MKKCKSGYYYCNTDKKCKPIPKGYRIGYGGYLRHDKDDDDSNGKKKNGNGNGNGGNGNGGNGGNGNGNGSGGNGGGNGGSNGGGGGMSEGSLHKWFKGSKSKDGKGGWVNVVTGGTCASDEPGEGTPKCVSSSKRASMTKAERLSAARRKKKADPGQQSKSGAAKPTYVSTDKPKKKMKETYSNWRTDFEEAYGGAGVSRKAKLASTHPPTAQAAVKNIPTETDRGAGNKAMRRAGKPVEKKSPNYKAYTMNKEEKEMPKNVKGIAKELDKAVEMHKSQAKRLRKAGVSEEVVTEGDKKGKGSGSKDACYHKVKSRYSVWPSAYASGALVKCRKVGAANWGNSSKKEEFEPTGVSFQHFSEKCWKGYEKKGMKTMFGKRYPNCVKKEEVEVLDERQKDSDNQRLSQERGRSNYGKASIRNVRATGMGGNAADPAERGAVIDARHKAHKEKRGVKTKGMSEAKVDDKKVFGVTADRNERRFGKKGAFDMQGSGSRGQDPSERAKLAAKRGEEHRARRGVKTKGVKEEVGVSTNAAMMKARKEAELRKKEQDAVAKKMRKEEITTLQDANGNDFVQVIDVISSKKVMSDWRNELSEDDMKGMSVKSGHKRPTKSGAGMTKKGVEAYRRRNPGSKLKTAVTTEPSKLKKGSKDANRRKSYCARSAGQMKKFPKAAKDPNSRLRQARRRWNC
tara:strand:+ start:762 stop:2828 length:2067 start_codon:yes stop_codon:yes gene_type:complete